MGYVSDFSPDGKLFALLDSDGKLKIWNTETNEFSREYIPDLHLKASCRCFEWITFKGTESNITTSCIALGTSKGGVEIYSYATNKIERKLEGNGHNGAVTSICLHNHDTLYTSGEDCTIVGWSLETWQHFKQWNIGTVIPTCIVSLPLKNRLLVACKELTLWSLRSHKLKYTYTGQSKDVRLMKVMKFNCNNKVEEYVLTASESIREISLWMMDEKKVDRKNALATFVMENAPTFISCSVIGKGFTMTAVTRGDPASGGVVHLFIVDDISDLAGGSPIKPKTTAQIVDQSLNQVTPKPIPIISATLNFSAQSPRNILIGYGSSPILRFENITLNITKKIQVLVREDPKALKLKTTTAAQFEPIVPVIHHKNVKHNTGLPSESKRKGEITMEELKAALSKDTDVRGTGISVVQLLSQALHNHDANFLKKVFLTKEENVIRLTIEKLPSHYIQDLVHELFLLTQKKTIHVQTAVCWLKILLKTRSSQLMALGTAELSDIFVPLLGILQQRTNSLSSLSKLSGRLDLLLNQIKYNTDDDSNYNHNDVVVFEDNDDSKDDFDLRSEHNSTVEEEEVSDMEVSDMEVNY